MQFKQLIARTKNVKTRFCGKINNVKNADPKTAAPLNAALAVSNPAGFRFAIPNRFESIYYISSSNTHN